MENLYDMLDLNGQKDKVEVVEITVRKDGQVVWVNVNGLCVFRACGMDGRIMVYDYRDDTQKA